MNKLFLIAITGEICLNFLHGIKFPYSPIKLLRDTVKQTNDIDIPKTKKEVLMWLRVQFQNNQIEEHALLDKAINAAWPEGVPIIVRPEHLKSLQKCVSKS